MKPQATDTTRDPLVSAAKRLDPDAGAAASAAGTACDNARILQICAFLLSYPDSAWHASCDMARSAAGNLRYRRARRVLIHFLDFVNSCEANEFEELYVRSFDFSQNTNLYLTSRGCKDPGQQRLALLSYKMDFDMAGFDLAVESPDYLPAVLELAATLDATLAARVLAHAEQDIKLFCQAIREAGDELLPYVELLDLMCAAASGLQKEAGQR